MSWRLIRTPLAVALLGVAAFLFVRRIDEVQAVLLGTASTEAFPTGRRVRFVEQFPEPPTARLVEVAGGFKKPLFVTHAGDGSGRLFVVEQGGKIRVVKNGAVLEAPFLDVTADLDSSGGERGLLGLAFSPDYPKSGLFYIAHTTRGPAGVVRRFRVSPDPDRADPGSAETVLSMEDPAGNHNGGMIAFGPDGYLWLGTGDGGSGGDPWNNAQNQNSLLGKMLRIDVRSRPYAIPADNPWPERSGYRPELWAIGLRNPWRFSFDRSTGELWIADVGQNTWEEIDVADPKRGGGLNFGWRTMEGEHCYSPKQLCLSVGLEPPIFEYGHDRGCSVTGGYVYRGRDLPALAGTYLFSDYCRGTIWSLQRGAEGSVTVSALLQARSVSSFGEDEAGELYVCDHTGGTVSRLSAAPRTG